MDLDGGVLQAKKGQVLLGAVACQILELMGQIVGRDIVLTADVRNADGFGVVLIQMPLHRKNSITAG